MRPLLVFALVAGSLSALPNLAKPALAQPVDLPIPAATTTHYPNGVKVAKTARGQVYTDRRGLTLYGMDMRTLVRWQPDVSKYCVDACAKTWEPLLAPAGSRANIMFPLGFREQREKLGAQSTSLPEGFVQPQKAPDWTIIEGAAGLQWVYKGWLMVFTRRGDKPRSTAFDGADQMTWNTLKFVPPVPQITAPLNVVPVLTDGAYALADKNGHLIFTGPCAKNCADWIPFNGGMASKGIGDWTISLSGDAPQWLYRGKPVFISTDIDLSSLPDGTTILRP